MLVCLESPDQPEVLRLIEELDAYQVPLYPIESHHGVDLPTLLQPNVVFAVARDPAGRAIGCGALLVGADYGEIKRMYAIPAARGAGVGRAILSLLESTAIAKGCTHFMLETGYRQPEALLLYERNGYVRCPPFGDYREDPNSVFMHKIVSGTAHQGIRIRQATTDDIPILNRLIPESVRSLRHGFYTLAQAEAAIRHVFGVDSQLVIDGTYFVATEGEEIVACGGWSWRRTLYGGDQRPIGFRDVLDPAADAARIRAFFVAGTHARRGIGALLLAACTEAASAHGFTRLELMSTLPGVPFYRKLGFLEVEPVIDTLPDGTEVGFVRMTRAAHSTGGQLS
jgi:putative acetyltransferase